MVRTDRFVTLTVGPVEGKVRVDAYVAANAQGLSRTLIGDKDTIILLDGVACKRSKPVREGQSITVQWTDCSFEGIEGQDIPLSVLYEDDDLLVIDKAQGMVVHPAAGNPDGTVVNALVHRYGQDFMEVDAPQEEGDESIEVEVEEEAQGQPLRPGIVHRLDKDTSGVMVIARNRLSHASLCAQFKEHTTEKFYIAIVKGTMEHRRGRIVTGIRRDPNDRKKFATCAVDVGKRAESQYLVLKQYSGFALVRIKILTGRTHQIRVHMQSIGHPVLGDPIYSRKDASFPEATLMLHALQLRLDQPTTLQRMKFTAPMPQRFKDVLRSLTVPTRRRGDEQMFLY